jgi:hypothetical protein
MRTPSLPVVVPPPPPRQLALPLEPVSGPPRSPLPPLGPAVPPRRVWRGLSEPTKETVRRAILRLCQQLAQEVRDDAAGDA